MLTTTFRRSLQFTAFLLAASVFAGSVSAQTDKVSVRLDDVVRFEADNKRFMGSVLVAKGDRVVFSKGYGLANMESGISNTPDTRYAISPLTKQITAAAILRTTGLTHQSPRQRRTDGASGSG